MQILPIKKLNGKFWLSQDFLLQQFTELTEVYFRSAARPRYKESVSPCFRNAAMLPDTGKSWRWANINGTFYYCYDNVSDKVPAMYKSNLPTRMELERMMKELDKKTAATDTETYLKEYLTNNHDYLSRYTNCKKEQQAKLATAAAIVEATINYIRLNNYDTKKNSLFIELANICKEEDFGYIPHNFRKFKDKILEAMQSDDITKVIKLPRAENKNASQYDDAEVESWIYQLRSMGHNYTNSFIIRKIKEICNLSEKPLPSDRWIGGIMERYSTQYNTAINNYGEHSTHANRYRGYIPLANAVFAGDCWQVDATRVNIIPHKNKLTAEQELLSKEEKAKLKKPRSIMMICVRDVHSGDILGTEYDFAENRWAYHNAIAMAVKESGYLPYEMVFDKFPGHNTAEFKNFVADLEARDVKVTFTSRATGKARLERHFGTLQTVFMQHSDYYYGEGIKSRRRYAHRSEQYLASLTKRANQEGYDFDAATGEADKIINAYRNKALSEYSRKYSTITKSPKQLHEDSEKPNVIHVEQKQYAYLFGLKKELDIRNAGLLITEIFKTEFKYRITDHNIVSRHKKVMVCYDLEDLSFCHLYAISDKQLKPYLGIAEEVNDVQVYGPDAKWGDLNKQQAIITYMNNMRLQELQHVTAVGDDIVTLLTPGTSSKDDYINAESSYTIQTMTVASGKKNTGNNAEDDFETDVRDQY
jgi:hypothetical protein